MKFLLPLLLLTPFTTATIECGEDLDEPGCVKCKNIPQDLTGLETVDLSPFGVVSKLKLVLADEADDPSIVDSVVEEKLKQFLDTLSTSLLELFLVRFNGLVTNYAIRNLQHLQSFNIINSNVQSLPDYLFENLEQINSFTIKEGNFDTINQETFGDSTKAGKEYVSPLKKLKLENCNIGSLQDKSFFYLKSAEVLDLSGNNIQSIDSSFLKWMIGLKKLDLSNNGIEVVPEDLLKFNRVLRSIDLHGNDLDNIPCEMFKFQIDLKQVNFTNNKLTKIQCHWIVRQGRHLQEVEYSGNLFHKGFAKNLNHTRGVNYKLTKMLLKFETGEKEDKKREFICQQCEKNLPPRKKIKLKTDQWQDEKNMKWNGTWVEQTDETL